jgi:hypothetical protein
MYLMRQATALRRCATIMLNKKKQYESDQHKTICRTAVAQLSQFLIFCKLLIFKCLKILSHCRACRTKLSIFED